MNETDVIDDPMVQLDSRRTHIPVPTDALPDPFQLQPVHDQLHNPYDINFLREEDLEDDIHAELGAEAVEAAGVIEAPLHTPGATLEPTAPPTGQTPAENPDFPEGWARMGYMSNDEQFREKRGARARSLMSAGGSIHTAEVMAREGLGDYVVDNPSVFDPADHQEILVHLADTGVSYLLDHSEQFTGATNLEVIADKLIDANCAWSVASYISKFPNQDRIVAKLMDPQSYQNIRVPEWMARDGNPNFGNPNAPTEEESQYRKERRINSAIQGVGNQLLGQIRNNSADFDPQLAVDGLIKAEGDRVVVDNLFSERHLPPDATRLSGLDTRGLVAMSSRGNLGFNHFTQILDKFEGHGKGEALANVVENAIPEYSFATTGTDNRFEWRGGRELPKLLTDPELELTPAQLTQIATRLAVVDPEELNHDIEIFSAAGALNSKVFIEALDSSNTFATSHNQSSRQFGQVQQERLFESLKYFDDDTKRIVKSAESMMPGDVSMALYYALGDIHSGDLTPSLKMLGITETGPRGEEQLRAMVSGFRSEVLAMKPGEDGDKVFQSALTNQVKFEVLKSLTNYDLSQFGNHDDDKLRDTILENIRGRKSGEVPGLSPEYEPSGIIRVGIKNPKGEWTEDALTRYEVLRSEMADVARTLGDKGVEKGFPILIEGLRDNIHKEVMLIDAKLSSGEEMPDMQRTNMQQRRDQLSALITPEDPDRPDFYPLKRKMNFEQNFATLARSQSLHSSMRKVVFGWSMRKNPDWMFYAEMMKERKPETHDIEKAWEFVEHITNRETFSEYFSNNKTRNTFKQMVSAKTLEDALARNERNAEVGGENIPLQFVPTRGPFMELSGDIADACWADTYESIAAAKPNMTAVIIKQNAGEPTERLGGAGLLMETKDQTTGEPVLVIRGLNPIQNLITDKIKADTFLDKYVQYARGIADRKKMKLAMVMDGYSGGAGTNRPVLMDPMQRMIRGKKIIRVPNDEVEFNGYSQDGFYTDENELVGNFTIFEI